MKKIICLLLAFALVFTLCACGKDDVDNKDNKSEKEDTVDTSSGNDVDIGEKEYNGYKVGDYITLGSYEQDNDTSNGNEDIEWLILDIQDGKALVISKYALDCKPYNTEYEDVTWETCTLRQWLNDDFISEAFSADEQSMIPMVTVSADENPENSTNLGNDTQDKIFLLSISEADKYFDSYKARECDATEYAVAEGCWIYVHDDDYYGNCWWWLRSLGYGQYSGAVYVSDGGDIYEEGGNVDYTDYGVRPAMWIELD